MRAFTSCGTVLGLLLAGAVSLGVARADELLVMPYSCKVVGGRPSLTPSDDQGHPVIGRREQQEFRACSPADPRLCRRWNVHRFDLDCGGVRVPWVDVAAVAGAGRGDGEAFVVDGHFELEMPARWSLPPDAPCARDGDMEGPGFRRFCAERLARVPRVTVAMPRGFAPMLGIDGIFVKDQSSRGAVTAAAPSHHDELIPEPIANPQRGKSQSQRVGAEALNPAPKKEPAASPAPPPPVEAAVPKSAPLPQPAPSEKTELSAAGSAAAGAAPVIPQIINGANARVSADRSETSVDETGALPDQRAPQSSGDKAASQSEVAGSGASVPDQVAMAEREDATFSLPALSGGPVALNVTIVTIGTLALLTLLTLAIVLRRGRAPSAPALSRDIASVSLGKDGPRDGQAGALAIVPEPLTGRDLDASPSLSSGPPATFRDAMPRTRAEALEVLGMGIAPDVNETAIKKIIDGLRLSWHPDHARDPADRAMREQRIKQINAAWDIISGKGAN